MKNRMKRAVSMMLTVVLSLSVLAGCKQGNGGKAQAAQKDSVKHWYAGQGKTGWCDDRHSLQFTYRLRCDSSAAEDSPVFGKACFHQL